MQISQVTAWDQLVIHRHIIPDGLALPQLRTAIHSWNEASKTWTCFLSLGGYCSSLRITQIYNSITFSTNMTSDKFYSVISLHFIEESYALLCETSLFQSTPGFVMRSHFLVGIRCQSSRVPMSSLLTTTKSLYMGILQIKAARGYDIESHRHTDTTAQKREFQKNITLDIISWFRTWLSSTSLILVNIFTHSIMMNTPSHRCLSTRHEFPSPSRSSHLLDLDLFR